MRLVQLQSISTGVEGVAFSWRDDGCSDPMIVASLAFSN